MHYPKNRSIDEKRVSYRNTDKAHFFCFAYEKSGRGGICSWGKIVLYYILYDYVKIGISMIRISKEIHGTTLITEWFASEEIKDNGILVYKEAAKPFGEYVEFDTLISDLTESEEDIKAHFSKGCKYKVNRAAREDVAYTILDSEDITDEILDNYLDFFEEFWKSKGTSLSDKSALREEIKEYIALHAFTLAYATVCGEIAVYHTHLYDDNIARLFHSASLFRLQSDEEGTNKNIIGMANRALHYEEMKYFKNKGQKTYDWGGAGKGEDVASITEFKESFGGEAVTYYDCTQTKGSKAKLVNMASTLKSIVKK